jgi:hypothetical protein
LGGADAGHRFCLGRIQAVPANLILVKNISVIGVVWGAQTERHPAWMSRTLAELLRWWEDSKLKPLIAKPFSLAEAWCGTRCPDLAALRRKGSAGDLTRRITGAARALGISRFNKPHLDAYGCGPPLTVARSRSHCPADQAQRAALMTDSSRFPSLPLPCRWLIEVVQR